MKTQIKKSNVGIIDTHIKDAYRLELRESKLFAILRLVEKKGTPIKANDNESLNGVKVIEYKKGHYIGFIKTTYKGGYFKLNTVALKNC